MIARLHKRRAAREDRRRRLALGELTIELCEQEILEDLFWPHPVPGRWPLAPASSQDQNGRIERESERVAA